MRGKLPRSHEEHCIAPVKHLKVLRRFPSSLGYDMRRRQTAIEQSLNWPGLNFFYDRQAYRLLYLQPISHRASRPPLHRPVAAAARFQPLVHFLPVMKT